ncbi:hypothetical protein D3C76_651540 [compost metagenome]
MAATDTEELQRPNDGVGTFDGGSGDGVRHVHDLADKVKTGFAQALLQFFFMGVVHQLPGQLRVETLPANPVCLCIGEGCAEYFPLMLTRFQIAYQVFDVAFVEALRNDRGVQGRQFEVDGVQILEVSQRKIGQGLAAGRSPGTRADLDLDLVGVDVEVVCLELFFQFMVGSALQ